MVWGLAKRGIPGTAAYVLKYQLVYSPPRCGMAVWPVCASLSQGFKLGWKQKAGLLQVFPKILILLRENAPHPWPEIEDEGGNSKKRL